MRRFVSCQWPWWTRTEKSKKGRLGMNEADRREKTMLDLFDWITDFVAGRDDVTADDIRLAIAREFADGPRERDLLLAQYRERAEAAVRRLKGLVGR